MERFIKTPNLPEGRVSSVIIGEKYDEFKEALISRGVRVFELPENSSIPTPVSRHADMSAYYIGGGRLIVSYVIYNKLKSLPAQIEIIPSSTIQKPEYPNDIPLNACTIGRYIFCKPEFTDTQILTYFGKHNIIPVNQGYARCSTCVLDEKHIITGDRNIHMMAEKNGISSLLIHPGFFKLPGYEYGFIGGSCFKLAADNITFTGRLDGHPDKSAILNFIYKLGLKVDYLSSDACEDIGSAIPLTEEIV